MAVLGATSPIGRAIARQLAARGARLILAGRDLVELECNAKDLAVRYGADACALRFDALDFEAHDALVEALEAGMPGDGLYGVIAVYGDQPDSALAQRDFDVARQAIDVNYASVVSLFEPLAARLEARGRGFLCAIGSVAGDRGRQSNYLYGSTKAALATYLDGLRHRLARSGVGVVTVKPGFVDTRLTWGKPGVRGAASPDLVARDVVRGIVRNQRIVYTPKVWRWIMLAIRACPDAVFRRLRL